MLWPAVGVAGSTANPILTGKIASVIKTNVNRDAKFINQFSLERRAAI